MAFGSCPRDRGAEAAAPIRQPMITGESGDTDDSGQSRTVLSTIVLAFTGWICTRWLVLFRPWKFDHWGDVASQRVARDLQSAWRSAGRRKKGKSPETVGSSRNLGSSPGKTDLVFP